MHGQNHIKFIHVPSDTTILLLLLLLTAIALSPGGSGYFTCTQIWKRK